MRKLQLINKALVAFCMVLMIGLMPMMSHAEGVASSTSIDRIQLVSQQINLLKNRYSQSQLELNQLQQQHDVQIPQLTLEKASKNVLEKAGLDIAVSKSNLDSISIELTDTRQTIGWLEKNIQEIQNQLNVVSMFGKKGAPSNLVNVKELQADLAYQQKLLQLEMTRGLLLEELRGSAQSILQFKHDRYNQINVMLKSFRLMSVRQQQVKDELVFEEEQNQWLQKLNELYAKFNTIDPATSKDAYLQVERDIFYVNENASYAYSRALMARYRDQIQQMKLAVYRTTSISLLNEISDQVQALTKQIANLDSVLQSRAGIMSKHISYLSPKKEHDPAIQEYIAKLSVLNTQYLDARTSLQKIDKSLNDFRHALDLDIQDELSSRQSMPLFGAKSLMDIGKEILLAPALIFQMTKSLTANLLKGVASTGPLLWCLFAFVQGCLFFAYRSTRRLLIHLSSRQTAWREKINSKWLSLQWLRQSLSDLFVISNICIIMTFFGVPFTNYQVIVYLALVWLLFNSLNIFARTCLQETTSNAGGHDVRLYRKLRWVIGFGGVITALTVFMHQLPLIYELKTLCDRVFLLYSMLVSLILLRAWDVVPNLILSHVHSSHPYFKNSVRFVGLLIPILMFGNSLIGLFGYLNLVKTMSSYEGIFLLVLVGYLILRGLLRDGLNQVSQFTIQNVSTGWLWNEAFIKPLDKILRITLFLASSALLFLLYGWDNQSPMVVRLNSLLHYRVASILNTAITPLNMIELFVVISVFYWMAKWTREFVFRLLSSRTKDMGVRNSIAILSQYTIVVAGILLCMRVVGLDYQALAIVTGMLAFGVGLGIKDLVNNFACGFLILLERPLRVGDIVEINNIEGEVRHIGGRAVTVRTWDNMDLVVPNSDIFNKSFTNWTYKDSVVRSIIRIKIGRLDNPHDVKNIITQVLASHKSVLKEPGQDVLLKEMSDTVMEFEIRFYVNLRQIKSRMSVISEILMAIWDAFAKHGIKPPYPQQEIFITNGFAPELSTPGAVVSLNEK